MGLRVFQNKTNSALFNLRMMDPMIKALFDPSGPVDQIEPSKARKPNLTLFYAPWCAHCRGYAPIYTDIAKRIKKAFPDFVVNAVNIDLNRKAFEEASKLSNDPLQPSIPTLLVVGASNLKGSIRQIDPHGKLVIRGSTRRGSEDSEARAAGMISQLYLYGGFDDHTKKQVEKYLLSYKQGGRGKKSTRANFAGGFGDTIETKNFFHEIMAEQPTVPSSENVLVGGEVPTPAEVAVPEIVGGAKKRHRRTPKRHTPKRHTPKRRTPKRRTPKRRTPKRRTPTRSASPKRRRSRSPRRAASGWPRAVSMAHKDLGFGSFVAMRKSGSPSSQGRQLYERAKEIYSRM
jgi:thiol-disulfide isomerase/thioredoxin